MNWKAFIHSVVAAVVSGAAIGGISAAQGGDFTHVASSALGGAIVGVLALLKSSPLVQPPTPPPPAVPPGPIEALKGVLAESAGPTEKQ